MSYVHPNLVKLYTGMLNNHFVIVGQLETREGVIIRMFDRNSPTYDMVCYLYPAGMSQQSVSWEEWSELQKISRKAVRRITKPKHKEKAKRRQIKLKARKQRGKKTWTVD